ncbi:xylulose kinase [Brachyspira pilosicoli B2904]|uniref:Xylulose kinase n=1 Tax=Brachyspira pilosicoli B2904 TaxID=1133568 RepID=J9UUH3_BRAPL|nr:xylulose kinase [Brachyspira pilosicoli B2904]
MLSINEFLISSKEIFSFNNSTALIAAPREAPPEGSIFIGHCQILAIIFNISLSLVGPPVTDKSAVFFLKQTF